MGSTKAELAQLSDLIGLIYEGATDPGRWTKDILPAIGEYLDSPASILYSPLHTPQNGGYFFLHGITQEHVDQYAHKHFDEDVWKIAFAERNLYVTGNVVIGDELVPRAQLLASNFYKECLSRNENMVQLLTSVVFGMESSASVPANCSFFRGSHHTDFNEESRARMRLVLPHLSRSLGVMQRLRSSELTAATTLMALDRLPSGVLLLDGSGKVEFANRSAQRMLENGDELYLRKLYNTSGLGELNAENAACNKAIGNAICATLKCDPYITPHFSECVTVSHTSGLAHYTLQFSALGNQNEFGGVGGGYAAIIFIADSAQDAGIDPAKLHSAYGLTPAEARVALALLELSTANEVAEKLGTSPHTVRVQIRHVYAKLGVDTRARFVKLMLGLSSHRS
jgi:DNA-binding CsgD family transcriptional regulator